MENLIEIINYMSKTGKPFTSGLHTKKVIKPSLDNLTFIPAQLSKIPVDYFKEHIETETIIGKKSKKPLKLNTPILIAAMSFGALGKPAKIALAKASTLVGTADNTGEGGMLPEERKEAKILIAQYSTARFGVNEEYLKSADAIEIKIGQGAKPGQGGLLPKEKVTEEIAKIRNVEMGIDLHSPAYHPDIKNEKDLKNKIKWLRKFCKGPIIVKIAAGNIEDDIKIAIKAGADVIALDCYSGGTGAAPYVMMSEIGIPLISAVVRARKVLDKLKAKQELIVSGGLRTGGDVAKAIALGADAVYMGSSLLIAMGCIQCYQCYRGLCPAGITTHVKSLQHKFDQNAAQHVANFINACTEEVKMIAGACGYDNIHKLSRNDLRSLDVLTEKITGIKLI
ncbi:MAG: FMN-binding glutamate synthase family protein [Candidatus Aenigmatarchaeota archaeon]